MLQRSLFGDMLLALLWGSRVCQASVHREDRDDVRPLWYNADEKTYERHLKVVSKEYRVLVRSCESLEADLDEKERERRDLFDTLNSEKEPRTQRLNDARHVYDGIAGKGDEIENFKLAITGKEADIVKKRQEAKREIEPHNIGLQTCMSDMENQDDIIVDVSLQERFVAELEERRKSNDKMAELRRKIDAAADDDEKGRLAQEMENEKKAYEDAVAQRWPDADEKARLETKLGEWDAENSDDLRRNLAQRKEAAEAEKVRLTQEKGRLDNLIEECTTRFRNYNDGVDAEILTIQRSIATCEQEIQSMRTTFEEVEASVQREMAEAQESFDAMNREYDYIRGGLLHFQEMRDRKHDELDHLSAKVNELVDSKNESLNEISRSVLEICRSGDVEEVSAGLVKFARWLYLMPRCDKLRDILEAWYRSLDGYKTEVAGDESADAAEKLADAAELNRLFKVPYRRVMKVFDSIMKKSCAYVSDSDFPRIGDSERKMRKTRLGSLEELEGQVKWNNRKLGRYRNVKYPKKASDLLALREKMEIHEYFDNLEFMDDDEEESIDGRLKLLIRERNNLEIEWSRCIRSSCSIIVHGSDKFTKKDDKESGDEEDEGDKENGEEDEGDKESGEEDDEESSPADMSAVDVGSADERNHRPLEEIERDLEDVKQEIFGYHPVWTDFMKEVKSLEDFRLLRNVEGADDFYDGVFEMMFSFLNSVKERNGLQKNSELLLEKDGNLVELLRSRNGLLSKMRRGLLSECGDKPEEEEADEESPSEVDGNGGDAEGDEEVHGRRRV